MIYPNIAEYEENDSQLARLTIAGLHEEINRLNNIINTMLGFNFFEEECPLNFGYKEECDEEKAQEVFYEDNYCEENSCIEFDLDYKDILFKGPRMAYFNNKLRKLFINN